MPKLEDDELRRIIEEALTEKDGAKGGGGNGKWSALIVERRLSPQS